MGQVYFHKRLLKRPAYLVMLLNLYYKLSSVIAWLHVIAIERHLIRIPDIMFRSPKGVQYTLKNIWFIRMLRRSLSFFIRTPLKKGLLSLINYQLFLPQESGCIIALPHSPYSRLLAEWCKSNEFAIVLAGGPWIRRTGKFNVPGGGFSGLRRLVNHLQLGGLIVVIGDNIGRFRCCPVVFKGKKRMASTLPARLARIAKVPILAVVPKFQDGRIKIDNGIQIDLKEIRASHQEAIQNIFRFYESEICKFPSTYSPYILNSLNRMSLLKS